MAHTRPLWLLIAGLCALLLAGTARGECGGSVNCIAVGPTLTQAQSAHHGLGPDTFTLAFGDRATGTVSPTRTVFVVAVTGPAGTMATLGPITITGADAADFRIGSGTTCSPSNGPVHNGPHCVVTVAFSPLTPGAKTATLRIPVDPPACSTCITGRVVTLTGNATQAPAAGPVANPRTENVPFNTPVTFDLASSVTGTFTQVAIATPPSQGTATLNGTVVTYTPSSGYSGADSFTYTATGPAGTSAPGMVTLNIGAPAGPLVTPRTLAVAFETPATIDLATGITGAFSSIAIASPAAFGTVSLQGSVATYTPRSGYSGPDSFSYTATGAGGTSLPALVSVTVGTLAPTARDAVINVPLNTPTALDLASFIRGSGTLTVSVRDLPLHGTLVGEGTAFTYTPNRDFFGTDRFTYVVIGNAGTSAPATVTLNVTGRPDPTRDPVVTGLLASQAQTARRFSMAQVENVQRRMESRHPGSAAGSGAPWWIGGTGQFGTREARGERSRVDFTTSGVTVGADRELTPGLLVGAALGAARDRTEVGDHASVNRARGFSATLYGSYQPAPRVFVDALVGYGTLDFRSRRYVDAVAEFAAADRDGRQWFASLAAGFEQRQDGLMLTPYARIDHSRERLDAVSESGVGPHALSYSRSRGSFTQGALGLRAEGVRETGFGWAKPRARAEYRRRLEGDFDTTIAYADLPDGPRFDFAIPSTSRDSFALGLGRDFAWRGGLTLGIDYQWLRAASSDSSHGLFLRISQDLDASGSPAWLRGFTLGVPSELDLQVDAGFMYDDNANRGPEEARLVDRSFSANMRHTRIFNPGSHTRVLLHATLGGEKFNRHDGLSRAKAGFEATLQYRPSAAFGAPTFGLSAQATAEQYESRMRDGYRYGTTLSMRQPITDRIGAFAAVAYNERNARESVFDGRDRSARLSLDYELPPHSTLYLSGEYRHGHFTSSTPPLYGFVTGTDLPDDAFRHPQLFAYRLEGNTATATLGYNYALGPRDSIDLSWRRIRSSATLPDPEAKHYAPGEKVRYEVNQLFLVYLLSF